ncbi:MAG TPA: hypothetical protein DCR40_17170 [Prolixibacteraceae bacterium]|nr:hypothetical protein [Prolixibacteraceae bacterium]
MKNYSPIRKLTICIIIISVGTLNLFSQPDLSEIEPIGVFVNGCIITNHGDTIYGKLKIKNKFIENNIVQIHFKRNEEEGDIYDAGAIQEFGIDISSLFPKLYREEKVWVFYESKPSFKKGQMVFMNRFARGRITVFQNRSSLKMTTSEIEKNSKINGISFSWSSEEGLNIGPSFHVSNSIIASKSWYSSYYVEKGSDGLIKVEKDNYDELWPILYGDCVDIPKEVDKNPELKKF